ncbi:MAG: FecR family protein [Nitrosomonas sp.]|nr:FecR family protein [Nitrosomonas sp.]
MPPSPPFNERQLKQALAWFFQLQSENCTDEDRRKFNRWLGQSEAHQAAYAHAERLWTETGQLKAAFDIPGLSEARQRRPKRLTPHLSGWIAGFLLGCAMTGIGWLEYSTETVTYATRLGEKRDIVLADGSAVAMNTATRMHVRISPLQRKITLDTGEAAFDVQHETFRSFTVYADKLRIRDIGTRFNIRRQQDTITVTVLQGAVEINGMRLDEGYQLHTTASISTMLPHPADIAQIEAWQHGRLIFRRAPLQDVAAELERYHPIHFMFADPAIARETVSGTFDVDDLALFLNSLEKAMPVRIKRLQDGQSLLIDWTH